MLNGYTIRNALCRLFLSALPAGLIFCMLSAHAAAAGGVSGGSGAVYDTLAEAFAANETVVTVTADARGCDIPTGCSVTVTGGALQMDGSVNSGTLTLSGGSASGTFVNAASGIINGAANCTGRVYNRGNTDSGANVYHEYSDIAGVSEVIYMDHTREAAVYYQNFLWIPDGKGVSYLIINHYVCTPDGARLAYSITYRYNNKGQTSMTLDAKKYPTVYCVMDKDQVIPVPPDTEVDYVFQGWYCKALGYDENALQKSLTIPAGTSSDLVLVSWWKSSPGHNAKKSAATTAMSSGTARGGASGALNAAANLLTAADDEEEDEVATAANVLADTNSGMRVRTASATNKHVFASPQTGDDIEALAEITRTSRFPWQWIGVFLGGAVALFAVAIAVKRKLNERNAATLEKLNIRD